MRIFYVIAGQFIAGGQRVNLDHVVALRRLGHDARLWILRDAGDPFQPSFPPGLEVPWQREVPDLGAEDVVVVGEMFGAAAHQLGASPARKVVHNQGPYYTFRAFLDLDAYRAWGAEAIICPSAYAAEMLRRMGWERPLHIVHPFLDPLFAPDPSIPKAFEIAVITAKRFDEVRLIRGIVRSLRPDLNDVPWAGFSGLPREEVARRMKRAAIFLATGVREGLGLPPLEALWSGALVAGFHGGGGREYATAENGDWFGDDEHFEVAHALIRLIDGLRAGERYEARRAAGAQTAEQFSPARFETELAATWRALSARP